MFFYFHLFCSCLAFPKCGSTAKWYGFLSSQWILEQCLNVGSRARLSIKSSQEKWTLQIKQKTSIAVKGILRDAGTNTKKKSSNRNSIHNLRTFISLYDLLRALNHSVRVQSASPIITQTRGEQTDRRTTANYCSEFSLIHYFAFINLDGCSSTAAAAVATASSCKKQDRKANSCDSHLASLCFLSRFRLSARLQYLRLNLERDPVVSRPSHQCRTPGRS